MQRQEACWPVGDVVSGASARRRLAVAGVLVVLMGAAACGGDGEGAEDEPAEAEVSEAEHAPEGVVQVLMPDDVEFDPEPVSGAVGTETVRVSLVGIGDVAEIGRGRAARQPAEGERFLVAEIVKETVEPIGGVTNRERVEMLERGTAMFSVEVDDAARVDVDLDVPSYTPLPVDLDDPPDGAPADPADATQRRLLVVSVPEENEHVDLVVASTGLEQRLSLLTGEPGPDNVAVLARENRRLAASTPAQDVSYTSTEFGQTVSDTQPVAVTEASLQWSSGSGETRRTAPPGRAILQVVVDVSGFNLALASELRLPDGTVVEPMPAEDEMLAAVVPLVAFEVPADFTDGTFRFGKDYTWEVPTGGTFAVDFAAPVEYAIDIPLDTAS